MVPPTPTVIRTDTDTFFEYGYVWLPYAIAAVLLLPGANALAVNLAFAVVTIWFGARLYRASLLLVRGRMKLLDAYRAG